MIWICWCRLNNRAVSFVYLVCKCSLNFIIFRLFIVANNRSIWIKRLSIDNFVLLSLEFFQSWRHSGILSLIFIIFIEIWLNKLFFLSLSFARYTLFCRGISTCWLSWTSLSYRVLLDWGCRCRQGTEVGYNLLCCRSVDLYSSLWWCHNGIRNWLEKVT